MTQRSLLKFMGVTLNKVEFNMALLTNDQEIKDELKLVGDLVALLAQITQGFSFAEFGQVVRLWGDIAPAIKDLALVFPEYAHLDDDARADLVAWVSANVSVPASATAQDYTQKVMDLIIAASKVFSLFGTKK
jgi:hypothetical protein